MDHGNPGELRGKGIVRVSFSLVVPQSYLVCVCTISACTDLVEEGNEKKDTEKMKADAEMA